MATSATEQVLLNLPVGGAAPEPVNSFVIGELSPEEVVILFLIFIIGWRSKSKDTKKSSSVEPAYRGCAARTRLDAEAVLLFQENGRQSKEESINS
jgi:hypothetical protein